ncbi:MAG: hypothetical protein R3C10_04495 [Pirellulales bacterium]
MKYPFPVHAALGVFLILAWHSATAHGHGDVKIQISAAEGQLYVAESVYTSTFGEPVFGLPPATELPGVDAIGGISLADEVALEVVGPLLFSTGQTGGSVEPTDGILELIAPDGVNSVFIDSMTTTLPPLDWLPLGGELTDVHGTYVLVDRGDDPPGAYGLQMRAVSPQFNASDPFLVVIGSYDFDSGLLPEAIEQLLSASVVITPLPGDANGDDVVDGLDYLVWAEHFGDDPAEVPPGSPANGDLNDDEVVDGLDYILWAGHFGDHRTTAVPEPAGLATLTLVSTTLVFHRRRRQLPQTVTA